MAKYCIQCGTALNEGARFCGQCGAVVPVAGVDSPATASEPLAATPAYAAVEHYEPASDGGVDDKKGPNWLLIGGGAGLIVLLVLYYFLFLHDDMAGDSLEDRIQPTEVSEEVAISKEFYAVTEANIRDKASTEGSTVLGKLSRGTAATGKLIVGGDGTSNWLELADGRGYIAAITLSEIQPPEIVKPLGDKSWTTDQAIEIWAQPDTASPLVDRVAAGTPLTLFGITANDFIEVKLKKGGVGYIADGARIAELANGKPIALAFNPNSCSFGPEIDALFSKMGDRIRANYKALENKEYPSEEARAKALVAVEGRSTFEKLQRSFEGLTVTAIAQHYESQSVYFADPASRVIEVLRSKGYKIGKDGSIPSTDLYAGVGGTSGEGARYGKSDLSCGV
ncbi:zinc-ribbon domain-containing protein [uncultured Sphingorhabdus sp.]|uniref:zinc-ribbon domain-containing protein n=1 Tax=uncultured Sphingorhabdus sp. TaxID=1686106 RepID=UPI0026169A65|nr:zinc-ribbon domain-containing protein [uncultured Sphingorhabdus sp.]